MSGPVNRLSDNPIAIVGLSSLFPQAEDVRGFWRNVIEGKSAITEVPETHWSLDDYFDPDPSAPDKTYCDKGGFIPKTSFSPIEFGLPPNVLEVTDVLQLLSLNVARDLFINAGYTDRQFDRDRAGVVLGITGANSLTQPLSNRLQGPVWRKILSARGVPDDVIDDTVSAIAHAYAPWEENSFPGMLGNVVAGRIANRFDLGGINCTIDAACASSLAAMRMAIDELTLGRADMMVTGGCDAENTILMYMCFSKTPAFSRSGVIRPFDVESDGTLIGEGIGMLMLKRLRDAERDGDRIYAVIKGLGSSSDGRFKSIYAPRAEGQVKALRRAYDDAGCDPRSIGLLEAHGTGTAVGDATEVGGLKHLMGIEPGAPAEESRHIALGSVKSQIGHTKAAAGAASAIKATLALHHKVLPPSINVRTPNPALGLDATPFYINDKSRPWFLNYGADKRRAGISSFGFGGTNFHLVLEEYQTSHDQAYRFHPIARPIVIGAATPLDLSKRIEGLLEGIAGDCNWAVRDTEMSPSDCRVAFVAADAQECRDKLAIARRLLAGVGDKPTLRHPKGVVYHRQALEGRIAGLFAGQGSQHVAMGLELALANDLMMSLVGHADAHFADAGRDLLSQRLYPRPAFDEESRKANGLALRETRYAQPAIGIFAVVQMALLRHAGLKLDMAGGHSFGELAALWAAGAVDDAGFIKLACARGAAMAPPETVDFDPGTMTAVNASRKVVEGAIAKSGISDVRLCNLNTADQQVVGGTTDGIEKFEAILNSAGLKFTRLPVSGAFHTPLVAHAGERFGKDVAECAFQAPSIPVYRNLDGEPYPADADVIADGLSRQLLEPVEFKAMVEAMYRDGARIFVEFGPRDRLSAMVANILCDRPHLTIALDRGKPDTSARQLAEGAAELMAAGVALGDLDPFELPLEPARPKPKAAVEMLGINYVSPTRRQAFAKALAEPGASCAQAALAPVSVEKSARKEVENEGMTYHDSGGPLTAHPARSGNPVELLGQLAARNAELHAQFLANQRDTVRELIGAMSRIQDMDAKALADRPGMMDGIREMIAMVDNTHQRASELHASYLVAAEHLGRLSSGGLADPKFARAEPSRADNSSTSEPKHEVALAKPAPSLLSRGVLGSVGSVPAPAMDKKPSPTPQPVVESKPVAERANAAAEVAVKEVKPVEAAAKAVKAVDGELSSKIEAELVAVVAEKTGYPADVLDMDMDMEADLGIDSIKRVEIMGAMMENHPNIEAPEPETMGQLRTLREVTDFMANAAAGGAPRPFDQAGRQAVAKSNAVEMRCQVAGIGRAEIQLKTLPAMLTLADAFRQGDGILISAPEGEVRKLLCQRVQESGLRPRILEWRDGEESELVREIAASPVAGLVHLDPGSFGSEESDKVVLRRLLLLAKHLKFGLKSADPDARTLFMTVTAMDGGLGIDPASGNWVTPGLAAMAVSGLVKTLAVEAAHIFCRQLDLSTALSSERVVDAITAEMMDADQCVNEVARCAGGERRAIALAPVKGGTGLDFGSLESTFFIVTGGARGITATCVHKLAEAGARRFLLIGRSPDMPEPDWARGIAEADLKKAAAEALRAAGSKPLPKEIQAMVAAAVASREIQANLNLLRSLGAEANYLSLDIANVDDVARFLPNLPAIAEAGAGELAVVHGAGILADGFIETKKPEDLEQVFGVKVEGLRNLLSALQADSVGRLVLFSSAAGLFGNVGQVDYAMANETLNRLATDWRRRHPGCQVTSINWGAWDAGMVSQQIKAIFAERGIPLIPPSIGAAILAEECAKPAPLSSVLLAGGLAPLSELCTPQTLTIAGASRVLRVPIAGLLADPSLADHAIDGVPVLPAAFALGIALRAVEMIMPGHEATNVGRFRVLKGVTASETIKELRLEIRVVSSSKEGLSLYIAMTDDDDRAPLRR